MGARRFFCLHTDAELVKIAKNPSGGALKHNNRRYSCEAVNSCCGIPASSTLAVLWAIMDGRPPVTVLHCSRHHEWDGASRYNIPSVRLWLADLRRFCLERSASLLHLLRAE